MRLKLYFALAIYLFAAAASGCTSDSGNASPQQPAQVAGQATNSTGANPTAAQQTASPQAAATGGAASPAATVSNACALLTSDDIKEVQGEAVSAMKPNRRTDSPFAITQCFYTTPTFIKSVSLEVTERGASNQSVREFWKANFERAEDKREAKNERRKLKGKPLAGEPAKPVSGIGDEAYWISTNANSTLYAFKKDTLVRISIGGTDAEEARKKKILTLAERALARL
ncbi:MAG TPA: hypothetical protein VK363_08305 [Pyrinomonadaceae bacterium]|nr:hypothetical protein [Pyrinomonadaceae bacterium]